MSSALSPQAEKALLKLAEIISQRLAREQAQQEEKPFPAKP